MLKWISLGVGILLLLSLITYELVFVSGSNVMLGNQVKNQDRYLVGAADKEYLLFDNKQVTGSDIQQAVERFELRTDLSMYFKLTSGTGCFAFNDVACTSFDYGSETVVSGTTPTIHKDSIYNTTSSLFISPQSPYHTKIIRKTGKIVGILVTN